MYMTVIKCDFNIVQKMVIEYKMHRNDVSVIESREYEEGIVLFSPTYDDLYTFIDEYYGQILDDTAILRVELSKIMCLNETHKIFKHVYGK